MCLGVQCLAFTTILKLMESGAYKEYVGVLSQIIFCLLQDGYGCVPAQRVEANISKVPTVCARNCQSQPDPELETSPMPAVNLM